ncbi:hypothetical protein R1sor_021219 [Riccia sorocarpa]|uniref:Uncharacterized protein n=1 Tax=Riccia sorocarpa TaxID=122646 RepID=A0ABD3GH61_9MARC
MSLHDLHVTRVRSKFVPFLLGVQKQNFKEVARILGACKAQHGITGDVQVMLAEDETRIKPRVRWESRRDSLIGFCGEKDPHTCSLGTELQVGSGEQGYNRIVESFQRNVIGAYARVIIVNPLHEKLPRLVICATVTCNSFTAAWVRDHWDMMKTEWDESCRATVGPIVGHASDGDSRRRKLIIADYLSPSSERWRLDWEGWSLSAMFCSSGDVYGLGDQDPIHNGKKMVNPLDRSTHPLVLGEHHACLEHVHLVYKLYSHDVHGLNLDDVIRRDRQNWAGPQRLCSRAVQNCLKLLEDRPDEQRERTLGTRLYLEIVGDYIDIFFSVKLDLFSRIVLCSKVSFFFRLWRLWLLRGNHEVSGSTQSLSEKNMVSHECWLDVQMSCHMVVLLCRMFRDQYPGYEVPLHLLGSDCCEHFFSRVGGMAGYERNYDFGDLMSCASGLNRIAWMEYGEENIQVGKSHVKQRTIWGKLHPLHPGEAEPNLADFDGLKSDREMVDALLKGFKEAQNVLTQLNMAPHTGVRDQAWWKTPWKVETDLKLFGAGLNRVDDPTECDVDITDALEPDCPSWDMPLSRDVLDEDSELDDQGDGVDDATIVGHETRHIMAEVLQQVQCEGASVSKYDPMVAYDGHNIYKATLVSQLLGNPTLSKDRLTRIKQSIYFNGVKPKPRQEGVPVCIMNIGSDCVVLFNTVTNQRSTRAKKGRRATTETREVWIGRVQKIRRKYNGRWGKTRTEIDLLDRPVLQQGDGPSCQVLFNWYKPINNSTVKFLYEATDLQWIDLESVITVVSMKMERNVRTVWHLDVNDQARIDDFLASL